MAWKKNPEPYLSALTAQGKITKPSYFVAALWSPRLGRMRIDSPWAHLNIVSMNIRSLLNLGVLLPVSLFTLAQSALCVKPGWSENFTEAQDRARAEGRPLLLDFTGSDWCGFCIRLDREVFAKKEFQQFAAQSLVLMEVDYPKAKPQPPELIKQNALLDKKFNIESYPTLILLSPEGKVLKRWQEPPKDLLKELKTLVPQK